MKIEYDKDYLRELYEDGRCKNRKYRFQSPVISKYQRRIDTLMAATRIEDLFVFNSLHFEAIDADNQIFSVRVDIHYRLIFQIRKEGEEPVITIARILELNNHYQ